MANIMASGINQGDLVDLFSNIVTKWNATLAKLDADATLADDDYVSANVLRENKERLARAIRMRFGVSLPTDSLFDVHVKRIHEYKRQLLNVLHVVARYNRLRANPGADAVPRVVLFAGKAAPAYVMAKLIIKLINDVSDTVNNHPVVGDRLKVIFVPNYDVSLAQSNNACCAIVRADLNCRVRGFRNREHEVYFKWSTHCWDTRRGQR